MGQHKNIGCDKFPQQGPHIGKRVNVCFNYDTDNMVKGTMIREDRDEPFVDIIQLDDGRVVLSTECMWQPA